MPEDLFELIEKEALKLNCLSWSEYFRRIMDERMKAQDRGTSKNIEERLDASMKELRKRINGLHLGNQAVFSVLCQLLIASGNEDLIEAALSNGHFADHFNSFASLRENKALGAGD
jgi:hypothetical protein